MNVEISAVELDGARIEYRKPDLGLAYSTLAPLVSEAWAYLQCENIGEAKRLMEEAREVIATASTTQLVLADTDQESEPKVTGKTTAAMLKMIAEAVLQPGVFFEYIDHQGAEHTRKCATAFARVLSKTAESLGLSVSVIVQKHPLIMVHPVRKNK
jgi:hypothetical protein